MILDRQSISRSFFPPSSPLVPGDDHLVRTGIPHGLGVRCRPARVMILSFGFIAFAVTVIYRTKNTAAKTISVNFPLMPCSWNAETMIVVHGIRSPRSDHRLD
jgi:hypothetical protein